ncbi:hypothetical protein N8525_03390 [Verrucomicrobiales bacterium]|nr:hypothetical protein [Verrucomicrobiales bacterium]
MKPKSKLVKVRTEGRATTIARDNWRDKRMDPDYLMVKTGGELGRERRALISFDVSEVDLTNVKSSKLGLQMVPSGIGFASHLPVINQFTVRGVSTESKEN